MITKYPPADIISHMDSVQPHHVCISIKIFYFIKYHVNHVYVYHSACLQHADIVSRRNSNRNYPARTYENRQHFSQIHDGHLPCGVVSSRSVNPRQILHDLDDIVHGRVALHAVRLDLQPKDNTHVSASIISPTQFHRKPHSPSVPPPSPASSRDSDPGNSPPGRRPRSPRTAPSSCRCDSCARTCDRSGPPT